MSFSISVWRKYYDDIRKLGAFLKESKEKFVVLEMHEIHDIKSRIDGLVRECTKYMNENGVLLPDAKWIYSPDDKTTHFSEPEFKYYHLMK